MKIPMFYSRISRASKGGLFAFACALFLMFGAQTGFAASVSHDCSADGVLDLGVDYNTGDDLTLTTGGTCTLTVDQDEAGADAYVSLNSLTVDSGVTLSHVVSGTTADHHNELDLHVTGAVLINGIIDIDGKGYLNKYTVGNTTSGGSADASGGSHGGKGGKPAGYALGEDYDSIKLPIYPGAGGGGNSGGKGGGIVMITAGTTITVNGDITADGGDITSSYTGGGAGGTVYLNAGTTLTLASSKVITANGGASTSSNNSGAGGGGRIALYYTTFTNNGSVQASGGNTADIGDDGAAGTIYHSHGGTEDLYVDSGTVVNDMRYYTEIDADNDDTFDNVYLLNTARLLIESVGTNFATTVLKPSDSSLFESDVDMTFVKVDTTGLYPDGGTAKFDAGLTLTDGSAGFDTTDGSETGTLITNGTTYINSGSVIIGSGLSWEANSDTIEKSSGIDLANITVKSGGTLTTSASETYDLELTLTGTLLLDSGGFINVSEKGYIHGNDVGSKDASGGSHGGKGGKPASYDLAPDNDSIKLPVLAGSGGGGGAGGDGGGIIKITAPTITLNGDMTADGGDITAGYTGGGAGGTIYLNTTTLTLDTGKVISANGGASTSNNNSGGGGGGRIALYYTTFNNSGAVQAFGGNTADPDYDGASGTIYHSYGGTEDLYIDSGTVVDDMQYATEIDATNDETFDNLYLVNTGRLLLESDATNFLVNSEIEIPTGTYFETDSALVFPTTGGGGSYEISSSSISLEGGIAQFYGQLTLATLDSDTNGGSGQLITNGVTYITNGSAVVGSGLVWEANSATIKTDAGTDLANITIKSGGELTTSPTRPGEAGAATAYDRVFVMDLTLSGTLLLEASGSLSADEKGYMGAHQDHDFYEDGFHYSGNETSDTGYWYGNTKTGGSGYTGGSHGGKGGQPGGYTMSNPYDSIMEPSYPGGGGGANGGTGGTTGGGAIKITADTITLNESVTVDSGDITEDYAGAGAGGSVYLNATTVTLASGKLISANGGDSAAGTNDFDGGGGGGRIAILYTTFNNSGDVQAYGGTATPALGDAAAGTIFLHDQSSGYGDLYVKNCSGCSSPRYNTSLLTTIPTADQDAGYNNGYVFNSLTVEQYGLLNVPSGLDANGTGAADAGRKFFCSGCANDGNGSSNLNGNASDGETIYNADTFGTYTDYVCVSANADPTASVSSVVQRTDGSGIADVTIVLGDADTGDTLTAKVEYSVGVGCGGGSDPTLDETPANVSGSEGTPTVTNASAYQIGAVTVVGGANTVQFDWASATDISSGDGTYCLVVTPNDGTTDGTPATKTYTADNVDPTGLTALTADGRTTLSILLGWSAVTETNFDHYEVWYGLTQVDVQGRTGTAVEWDNTTDDVDLGTITTTDTTIDGLSPNIGNFFKIWAVDTFGNEETVTDIQAYTDANTPGAPTVAAGGSDTLNVIVDENSNPSTTEYAIKVGALYVQANGTLGASEVWQTYTTWGGATGVDVTGLTANTSYNVSVKARNGDSYETALSTQTPEYTLAGPVTDVSLVDTVAGMDLYWTDAGQAGLEIYLAKADGSVCDSTYDILEYDDSAANATSPRPMGAGTDHCHRVRIGSYNDAGVLNTAEYAFSGDLVTSSTSSSSTGGSSGGSSTAFYSVLSNTSSSSDSDSDAEADADDASDDDADEESVQEQEVYEEDGEVSEDELEKPVFEFDFEEKYVKEPIRYFEPLELIYDKYDFEVYERKTPEFKLASELDFKYMELEPIELEKSLKEYFEDEEVKKELFKDVIEEFAEEFMEDDFAKELLEELGEDLDKEVGEEPGEGEEELDLREATDEVLEEILGEDMEDIDVFEPELDDDEDEPVVEEDVVEEKTDVQLEEEAVKILEELTVEEIVIAGVSEVVEDSIKGSVRKAIEIKDEVEVHTDKGIYIVDNVEDIVAIIEELDEDELEKIDLDNDGMNDLWQMSHGYAMFNSDPDGDGIPTSVEVYCGWDPINADSLSDNLANTKVANLKGNTFGNVPAIRACGEEGSKVDIVLFDVGEVFGDEKLESEEELTDKLVEGMRNGDQQYAGSMMMDESNQGILLPLDEIEDGRYIVMLSGEDGVEHLSTLTVENDKVPAAAEMSIGSKGLRLGFVIGNTLYLSEKSVGKFNADSYIGSFPGAAVPVITGQIADFESLTVVATWKSRTFSSTAFTDVSDGTFELEIPDSLPPGAHDIVVYLYNENDDLVSSATVLQFMK